MNWQDAKDIACEYHKGQTRWDGIEQYIEHPRRVANKFIGAPNLNYQIVAWLHDTLEDTDLTIEDLLNKGISNTCLLALIAITHRDNEPYAIYIERVGNNTIAREVKVEDIKDNLNGLVFSDHKQRIAKYELAILYLESLAFRVLN